MITSFSTDLLSAQKTGTPNLVGTSLSSVGVSFLSGSGVVFATQTIGVVSLSTNDAGISFTPKSISVATNNLSTFSLTAYPLSTVNVGGSVFNIPTALNGSSFGIVKVDRPNVTVFTWLSTTATVPLSDLTETRDASTQNARRLWLYGYV